MVNPVTPNDLCDQKLSLFALWFLEAPSAHDVFWFYQFIKITHVCVSCDVDLPSVGPNGYRFWSQKHAHVHTAYHPDRLHVRLPHNIVGVLW